MKSMRKFVSLILSISIVVAILISTSTNIYAVDSEHHCCTDYGTSATQVSTLYQTDKYATEYFYNLTTNLGHNVQGSCCYVAMGMLLSYYDTYWHDGIVSEVFDKKVDVSSIPTGSTVSPGIKSDSELNYSSDPAMFSIYYSNVVAKSNQYLHYNLIHRGILKNYHNYNSTSFGATPGVFYDVLKDDYMLTLNGITFNKMPNPTYEKIAEQIDNGNPVIIVGWARDIAGNSHAMVAYDYQRINGTITDIYVHMGWIDSSAPKTHVSLASTPYSYLTYGCYLDVSSMTHRCSDNYETVSGGYYCPCMFEMAHPEHDHDLIYVYDTNTKHKITCVCGYLDSTSHVVAGGSSGFAKCLLCNGIVNLGNDLGQLDGIGTENEINSTQDNVTIVEYITANGSYIRSDGIIVLAEEDVKPYLSGELIISE